MEIPWCHYVQHVKTITDISHHVDMVKYIDPISKCECVAICPTGTFEQISGALIFQKSAWLHAMNDSRFEFGKTHAFDIALPVNMFPHVLDFFTETFVDITTEDLLTIALPERFEKRK